MSEIIITPKSEKDTDFLITLLKGLNKVKTVRVEGKKSKKNGKSNLEAIASEKSLAKEWLSAEDNRWDNLLK